jgi:hypothetical protein
MVGTRLFRIRPSGTSTGFFVRWKTFQILLKEASDSPRAIFEPQAMCRCWERQPNSPAALI